MMTENEIIALALAYIIRTYTEADEKDREFWHEQFKKLVEIKNNKNLKLVYDN